MVDIEVFLFMKFKEILNTRLGKNSIISIIDQILHLGMSFVLTILLARYLGVDALGAYSLGLAIVGVLSIFCDFGIGTIMTREVAKNPKKTQLYLGNALGIKLLISFPLLILMVLVAILILGYNYETSIIILLIAANSTMLSLSRYVGAAFVSLHRNDVLLKINVLTKIFMLVTSLVVLSLGNGLQTLLVFFICLSTSMFFYSIKNIRALFPEFSVIFNKRFNKVFILTSMPLIFASAAEFINLRIDTVFLASILDQKAVGLYTAAFNVFIALTLIPLALNKVFFPNFIDHYIEDSKKAFKLFNQYTKYLALYSIIVSVVLLGFSDLVISILYGQRFETSGDLLMYLAFALPGVIINRHYKYSLLALRENAYYFKITAAGSFMNLGLNYFMISSYGIVGAVVATVITEVIVMAFGYRKLTQIQVALS